MKKLFLLALTSICCLALTLPAMGGVKVGGMITSDFNYIDRDEARAAGGNIAPGVVNPDNGFEDLSFDVPYPLNFLYVAYTSKDKKVGGMIRVRFGSAGAANLNSATFGAAGNLDYYYGYITYRFSDQFSMQFGRQNTVFAPMSPSQLSGFAQWGHIVGIGYGNQNHTSTKDGMIATIKASPMISINLGIFDNDTDNAEAPRGVLYTGPAGLAREENDTPRFDVAIPITIANFKIIPSFTYLTQEYDQVVAGSQNDVDIWGGALSARAGFGPFSITGEIMFGENLGDGNYSGGSLLNSNLLSYVDAAGNNRIQDSDDMAFFIDLAFKFGPATLHGIYGQTNSESEGNPIIGLDAAEYDITRQMWGFACPISIGGGFTIRPELFFYDMDDDALMAGVQNLDMGEETVFSLMFQLYF